MRQHLIPLLFPLFGASALAASPEELPESPCKAEFVYKGEWSSVAGGLRERTTYIDNVDLKLSLDAEAAFGWQGVSFYLQGLANSGADSGQSPFLNVGDSQGTSNIATRVNAAKLYAAWVRKDFADGRLSALFGLFDLNSEFYATDSSGVFLNASFGIGLDLAQTGVNGPSIFPTPAPALRLRAEPREDFYLQTAVFNAQAGDPDHPSATVLRVSSHDGVLWITETGFTPEKEGLKSKYALGGWGYTRSFDDLRDGTPRASTGAYLLIDQALSGRLSWFLRNGVASDASNLIRRNTSVGLLLKGPFSRDNDRFGIAVTQVAAGGAYLETLQSAGKPGARSEEAYEISYHWELRPGWALHPDFQYVVNPGFDPGVGEAQVSTLRFEISF
ncbi:MAG: carbohydrate porin [Bdellovibrionaceae bacterium]|nr:carbohydrate porin [Pseudobdellovibrionaceae bacterium]